VQLAPPTAFGGRARAWASLSAAALALSLAACSGAGRPLIGPDGGGTTGGSGTAGGSGGGGGPSTGGHGGDGTGGGGGASTGGRGGAAGTGAGGASTGGRGGAGTGTGGASAGGRGGAGTGTGGASGSAGASGGGSGGSGTGGGASACPSGTTSSDRCPTADAVCTSAGLCCKCIAFTAASCGLQWGCSVPANNAADCPATAPASGAACPTAKRTCQYCADSGPVQLRCTQDADAGTAHWAEAPLLTCTASN